VNERTGTGTFVLLTPTAGKAITIKGVMVASQNNAEIDVRFASGVLVYKSYLSTQMGSMLSVMKTGAVNEVVQVVIAGAAGGQKTTIIVNYEEN
jgi:hypothetical protein